MPGPGPDLSTEAAAALADQSPDSVRVGLRGLRQAYLLQVTGRERWGLHDLVRAHTTTRTPSRLDPDQLHAAQLRLLEHYATTTEQADSHLHALPGQPVPDRFTGQDDALAWLDAERATLLAALAHAATTGHHTHAVRLGNALAEYLAWRRYLTDWVTAATHAHTSSTHLGPQPHAVTANILGNALREARRFAEALTTHQRAIELFREAGDRHGEAMAWNNLGVVLQQVRRFEEALSAHERARDLHREAGDRHSEAMAWNNLGVVLQQVRRFEEAIAAHERAGDLFRDVGDHHREATAWNNLGLALQEVERFEEALTAHQRAVDLFEEVGDRHDEAQAWNNLGLALRQVRRFDEAIAAHERAGDLFRDVGDRHGEGGTWGNLGVALLQVGRSEEAIAAQERAVALFREAGDRHREAKAWHGLGLMQREARRLPEARRCWGAAMAAYRDTDDTLTADAMQWLLDTHPEEPGSTEPAPPPAP